MVILGESSTMVERATLMVAASESDSNLYYATRFVAPDPFIFLEVKGERLMVMSDLELDRARSQATVDRVLSYSEIERRLRALRHAEPGERLIEPPARGDAGRAKGPQR